MYTVLDVKKAIKGSRNSFVKIMQTEKNKLYRIAFLYVKNESDAVDIVQETTYKAFISISKLKEPNQISSWLKRVTINCAIDFIRRQKKIVSIDMKIVEAIPVKVSPSEEKVDLYHLLDKLNEKDKTIIILKYYEDLTNREIAVIMNCPEGTIKSSIHRILKKLKGYLEEGYMNG